MICSQTVCCSSRKWVFEWFLLSHAPFRCLLSAVKRFRELTNLKGTSQGAWRNMDVKIICESPEMFSKSPPESLEGGARIFNVLIWWEIFWKVPVSLSCAAQCAGCCQSSAYSLWSDWRSVYLLMVISLYTETSPHTQHTSENLLYTFYFGIEYFTLTLENLIKRKIKLWWIKKKNSRMRN